METGAHWLAATVTEKYTVSTAAVIGWKRNAKDIMSVSTATRAGRRVKRIKKGHFTEPEASPAIYMLSRVPRMH